MPGRRNLECRRGYSQCSRDLLTVAGAVHKVWAWFQPLRHICLSGCRLSLEATRTRRMGVPDPNDLAAQNLSISYGRLAALEKPGLHSGAAELFVVVLFAECVVAAFSQLPRVQFADEVFEQPAFFQFPKLQHQVVIHGFRQWFSAHMWLDATLNVRIMQSKCTHNIFTIMTININT